ncbi:MAG TPA: hypothetical protein PLF81_30860 [Candidatus Anammoximicrobium sp.]|nr:hypothetical protein [Candidatus Anammoximicrobium sp.]
MICGQWEHVVDPKAVLRANLQERCHHLLTIDRFGRGYFEPLIPTRWTAVVAKEDDGKWRIRSMHIGTNFLDNPLLNTVQNSVKQSATGAGVIGVLVGLALGFVIGRRRR